MTAVKPTPGPRGPTGATGAPGGSTHIERTYALFAGATTDGWSTPDAVPIDITDDIDIVAWIDPDDWTPAAAQLIAAKWDASGKRSYQLLLQTNGTLRFQYSVSGSNTFDVTATVAWAPTTTGPVAVRCHAQSNVAGAAQGQFYWSTSGEDDLQDATSWTQIGDTDTNATPGPFANKTGLLWVGRNEAASPGFFNGRIYRAQIWHGDSTGAGTLVANFDATNLSSVAAFTAPSTGETWTPSGSAAIASDPYVTNMEIGDGSVKAAKIEGGGSVPSYVKRSYMMQDPAYAAVFDGVTETATQMLAAQTAITVATPAANGNLYTGRGIAMVGQGLVIKNKVKWVGEGRDATIIKPHSTYPATKVTLTLASVTSGTSTITLSSTADFSFAAGDVGRLLCVPTAGAGGYMVVEKIAFVDSTTQARINTRTTFGSNVTGGEAYVCTPLVEIGDAGAFYCGLEGIHLWCQDFQSGTGLVIGAWTEYAQEQGFLDHFLITGASLGAIRSPVTSGSEKNFSIRDGEVLSGSGGPAPHTNADMIRVHGSVTIDRNTVIGSNDFTAPAARSSIALNGCTGVLSGNHTEGSHEGVIIGEGQRCIGVAIIGHGGHYNQTTSQFRIALPASGENRGITIQSPSIGGTPSGTPIMVNDQDVNTVNYGEGGAGVTTGDTLALYARGRTGATPTRIV